MDVELIEKGKGIVVEKVYSYEDEVLVTGNFYLKPIEIVILKKGIAYGVRRHIVGGVNRTLISALSPLRLCRIGTCRRLQTE